MGYLMGRFDLEATGPVSPPPASEHHARRFSFNQISSGLFFCLGGIILFIVLMIVFFVFKKLVKPADLKVFIAHKLKRRRSSVTLTDQLVSASLHNLMYFDFQTLKKATKNFHRRNLLGQGGFGPVFLGKLENGESIAVKQLLRDKSHQGEKEFLAEVRMITSIQHKNLVRLLGCCSDGAQRLLVYEYLKNRSLDLILYGKSEVYLNWKMRRQIIIGVARGLQYLHEDSHLRIVHRDIKASNILLDEKFQPRIGDFGLARFFPEDQAFLSATFGGTLGYTAPEYAIRGELSEKADIYSFGVLVLEIISCRRNTDLDLEVEMQYLPEYAWKLLGKSEEMDLLDTRLLSDGVAEEDVMQVLNVAFLCLQPLANLRPPMSQVVTMLSCKAEKAGGLMGPHAFLDHKQNNEKYSRDTISVEFSPSPTSTDSISFPKYGTK